MDAERTRKLAVLLHADVVGSTKLVQEDESIAHQRILSTFQRLAETTDAYGGIAHEIRGDALVAEFSRASDAVCAALAFQAKNIECNAVRVDQICPEVRVGISLGEVVIADGTVTGAGVVVQGAVSETVPDRMPFEFDYLGEKSLKGFDNPVRAFVARVGTGATIPEPESVTSAKKSNADSVDPRTSKDSPDKPSIVVLPFRNATGDPQQDYVSEGIGSGLVTELSRNRTLTVQSAVWSKHLSTDRVAVGREFGVRYLLEGSVQKSGPRLRITVQVIDAVSGEIKWADHLDRTGDDILTLQDEIAATGH
jgi:adenylate cyclase